MTITELIAECTACDYKETLEEKKPKSWLKSVSAFANTLGGSLFFGVDNDGNVKGLEKYKEGRDPVFKSSTSQFMTIIYSVDYKDAGKDTGKDIGKDTGKDASKDTIVTNRPDIYVQKLIKVVGNRTLTVKNMMELLNLQGADNFRKRYLNPAIKDGFVTLLYPDNITKKGQAYYLTELGKTLIEK